MAHPTVVSVVTARLRAGFERCEIYGENDAKSPPEDGGPWLMLDFPWCTSRWVAADEFLEEGGFRARLQIRAKRPTAEARDWLEEVAALFRGQAFAGVQCFAAQSPSSDDRNDAGGYFRLEVTVPYQFIIEG